MSTKEYIAALQQKVTQVPLPAGKAMVMQMPIKGIRKMGEADLEVKIKGQEVDKLFALAGQVSQTMNRLSRTSRTSMSRWI